MSPLTLLVVAKAPVPGTVKTRLAADLVAASTGDAGRTADWAAQVAAEVAAAALLDTIQACTSAVGAVSCRLALAGELAGAVRAAELRAALVGWRMVPQCDGDLGRRLAHAHAGVAGPVLQIGMDTPQVTGALLRRAAAGLDDFDAVLGPATDGGWWTLGLREGRHAAVLEGVEMSTPHTGHDTRRALEAAGLSVGLAEPITDIDRLADLAAVAAAVPGSRCAAVARTMEVLR